MILYIQLNMIFSSNGQDPKGFQNPWGLFGALLSNKKHAPGGVRVLLFELASSVGDLRTLQSGDEGQGVEHRYTQR